MPRRRRWAKFKRWLSHFFTRDKVASTLNPDPLSSGGFFTNAQSFVINQPTMSSILSDSNTVTYAQGDTNRVSYAMKLLSDHIIPGAAHDSSERNPPPRCHPQTRVGVIARITAWFGGQTRQELLLWITGPAGVGKSAVVQSLAEYLADSGFLGASVFISRPNKRNDSGSIFVTIAYQLATRIEEYRSFITEQLSRDPGILRGNIASQFKTLIVEPFAEKRIVAGGRRWGVLLDGLDELEGAYEQCMIIQLISSFALEHRDAPLVWVISSRPEPHIYNVFSEDAVRRSCWSEDLPVDSTETTDSIEHFLRSSFEILRNRFPQSIPSDWPSESAFLALTTAISGLFIYAEIVMEFIRDPDYADPVSRLEVLLSAIDASHDVSTVDNPFVQLDVLYHQFLSSIPARLWPTTKQLLGFVIYHQEILDSLGGFNTLRGMAVLFGLTPHVIYPCLLKCHPTLRIPDWGIAHKETLVFLHASFAYYLKDPSRSRAFHVGSTEEIERDVTLRIFKIWNECSGDDTTTASVESKWHHYCSKLDDKTPSGIIVKYHAKLFRSLVDCLALVVCRTLRKQPESPIYAQLIEIHMIKLCYYLKAESMQRLVSHLMTFNIDHEQLLRQARLEDLEFGHLDWKQMSPARVNHGSGIKISEEQWLLHRPRSGAELETFVSELQSLQEGSPELEVIIMGGVPKSRVAAFKTPLKSEPESEHDFMYYIIPCPQ